MIQETSYPSFERAEAYPPPITPSPIISIFVSLCAFVRYDLIRRRQFQKKKDEDRDALLAELEALRAEKNKKNEDTQV